MTERFRILILTHSFNSLTQRLFVELNRVGHTLSIEFDIHDDVTREAVALFKPDLILATFLKRAIPRDVYSRLPCLVVHPGVVGDRGPASLDWAILDGEEKWGVTILQANDVMDGGPVWATREFAMRSTAKSDLYRNEVTSAAVEAVFEALEKLALHRSAEGSERREGGKSSGVFQPLVLDLNDARINPRPPVPAARRRIDWQKDATEIVLRKIRSADSSPGARGILFGEEFHLFGVESEDSLRGVSGEILARRGTSICVATIDGAVWISHLKRPRGGGDVGDKSLKLPATTVLGERAKSLPDITVNSAAECIGPDARPSIVRDGEIVYQEDGAVGSIYFPFYNGAMGTEACLRLNEMVKYAFSRPTRVLVLWGGPQFWSNGLNLNLIESDNNPAEESWRNINAMDDLVRTLIACETHLTVAVLRGNAGAGGAFLALAADRVFARRGIVLNPHYKNMGNLFGSEYWTYSLPKRVGAEGTKRIMDLRLPIGTTEAAQLGLIDVILPDVTEALRDEVLRRANEIAGDGGFAEELRAKIARRRLDEAQKPLDRYREEELKRMRLNFFGFDSSYHVARYNFVYKVPMSKTPLHLASHRRINKS